MKSTPLPTYVIQFIFYIVKESIYFFVLLSFIVSTLGPFPLAQANEFRLPAPGEMVDLSSKFDLPVLKGIKLDPQNPFKFNFFVDRGDSGLSVETPLMASLLQKESEKLIKYFLASLTIPEKDLWVNLSPYEKNRIVPQEFGQTEMGRDLLAEDYILKQITASLIYPENQIGKEFWKKVYAQAQAKYGTTNIPINTFNKVWIIPEKAVVYEKDGVAFILENHLKVMLEQDYLSLSKHQSQPGDMALAVSPSRLPSKGALNAKAPQGNNPSTNEDVNSIGSQIVREIVIPALTKEVNEGKNFAQLRQVFYSLILATWSKKKIKDSIINKVYSNRNKIQGLTPTRGHVQVRTTKNVSPSRLPTNVGLQLKAPQGNNQSDVEYIYQQYIKAFKKGVFNYIKEEPVFPPPGGEGQVGGRIPRKYFSGGVAAYDMDRSIIPVDKIDPAQFTALKADRLVRVGGDMAMSIGELGASGLNPAQPPQKLGTKLPAKTPDKKKEKHHQLFGEDISDISENVELQKRMFVLLKEMLAGFSSENLNATNVQFKAHGLILLKSDVLPTDKTKILYIPNGTPPIEEDAYPNFASRGITKGKDVYKVTFEKSMDGLSPEAIRLVGRYLIIDEGMMTKLPISIGLLKHPIGMHGQSIRHFLLHTKGHPDVRLSISRFRYGTEDVYYELITSEGTDHMYKIRKHREISLDAGGYPLVASLDNLGNLYFSRAIPGKTVLVPADKAMNGGQVRIIDENRNKHLSTEEFNRLRNVIRYKVLDGVDPFPEVMASLPPRSPISEAVQMLWVMLKSGQKIDTHILALEYALSSGDQSEEELLSLLVPSNQREQFLPPGTETWRQKKFKIEMQLLFGIPAVLVLHSLIANFHHPSQFDDNTEPTPTNNVDGSTNIIGAPVENSSIPTNKVQQVEFNKTKGGIDLNPAQMSMQIKKEGEDFKFNFNGIEIDAAQVTGATFKIRTMTPVTNLPEILGLNQRASDRPDHSLS